MCQKWILNLLTCIQTSRLRPISSTFLQGKMLIEAATTGTGDLKIVAHSYGFSGQCCCNIWLTTVPIASWLTLALAKVFFHQRNCSRKHSALLLCAVTRNICYFCSLNPTSKKEKWSTLSVTGDHSDLQCVGCEALQMASASADLGTFQV